MANSPTVTFDKHKGLSVVVLVDKHPEYCNWIYHLDSSGQGSAHVEKLCQDIKDIKEVKHEKKRLVSLVTLRREVLNIMRVSRM